MAGYVPAASQSNQKNRPSFITCTGVGVIGSMAVSKIADKSSNLLTPATYREAPKLESWGGL